jgi:2-polyprenyl-3-methyl-5-hydroxy-6-metoxy-1,4-benzoquinol methylase
MNLEKLSNCPLCNSTELEPHLSVTDFTTTLESFKIEKCCLCNFVFTNPRPTPADIGNYYQSDKYISHTDGGKGLLDKIYLVARKFTLTWKYNLITANRAAGELLDVGCGTGEFISYMKSKGWRVTGMEPSATAREKASAKIDQIVYPNLEGITQQFDVITLWHVLEHVHQLKETVTKLKSLLKANGTIFIAVPNYESPDAKRYQQYWAAYDVPRHLWHFSKSSIGKLMADEKLKIDKIIAMKLDAYYVSLLSEKYKNPKQNILNRILKATITALLSNLKARKEMNYSSFIYIIKK